MTVWAFNKPDALQHVQLLYREVKKGKSRFGYSWSAQHNLKLKDNWTAEHSKQLFLLRIKEGDWIVHINMPEWGKCVAARVVRGYNFDEGVDGDFRHFFEIDTDSIVEFERKDLRLDPRVNLTPRYRYHRVYAVDEFESSIRRIESDEEIKENEELHHLWNETDKLLKNVTRLIHEMYPGKKLEGYLAEVFRRIPGVVDVNENGSGWGTDFGADLIVTVKVSVAGLDLEHKIVVQVKSHERETRDKKAVDQIRTAIETFDADAGMIITTGERTEELEIAVAQAADALGHPIDLLADKEVAQFVIKNAADQIFRL